MDANKYPSDYEEALDSIAVLRRNEKSLHAFIESDDRLIKELRRTIADLNAQLERDVKLFAKYDKLLTEYEELIYFYKKERGE